VLCVKPDHAEGVARLVGADGITRLLSVVAGLSTARSRRLSGTGRRDPLDAQHAGVGAKGRECDRRGLARDERRPRLGRIDSRSRRQRRASAERNIDAVTGLSGPMPAYLYLVVEALIEAGVHQGLSRDVAQQLVVDTFEGSAALLSATGDTPEELRASSHVTRWHDRGGTAHLESRAVRSAFIDAVAAAAERSRPMGR
jgi:pyrroline-5-carboxylate reductase